MQRSRLLFDVDNGGVLLTVAMAAALLSLLGLGWTLWKAAGALTMWIGL